VIDVAGRAENDLFQDGATPLCVPQRFFRLRRYSMA
jgi:hypothetical protein